RDRREPALAQPVGEDRDDEHADHDEGLVPEDGQAPRVADAHVGNENTASHGGRVLGEGDDVHGEAAPAHEPALLRVVLLAYVEGYPGADSQEDESGDVDECDGAKIHEEVPIVKRVGSMMASESEDSPVETRSATTEPTIGENLKP